MTIYGDGSQTRSFCYVDDMVDGLIALWRSAEPYPVNLGNPDERTIIELARMIAEVTETSSDIVFEPLPEDDPRVRCPDITRARELLGWKPKVSLQEGLERTIRWFASTEAAR
jgi:nucleoside-diphosphate-sugar epimerase